MKNILIVDDDKVTQKFFSSVLKPHRDSFQVITAENGKDAIDILNNNHISLVLTDLMMPVMDGYKLLAYMSKNFPQIPVYVMTAKGSSEIETKIKTLGSLKYFEKPMDIDVLVEAILEELNIGSKSTIWGVSLPSFMQLVQMENKTCTLTVSSGKKAGLLYFLKGDLIAAKTGRLTKAKAAYEMISWDNTEIEVENVNRRTVNEINQPLMSILMEGLKLKDEKIPEEKKEGAPPPEVKVILNDKNVTTLECPECGHSYTALIKKQK